MRNKTYISLRAELIRELGFLKSKRLWLCARARVRKIASLDNEFMNIPVEQTKNELGYYEFGKYNKKKERL